MEEPKVLSAAQMQVVIELVKSEDCVYFTRIVFDTAPTGHMLRLLMMPELHEASLGSLICLLQDIAKLIT